MEATSLRIGAAANAVDFREPTQADDGERFMKDSKRGSRNAATATVPRKAVSAEPHAPSHLDADAEINWKIIELLQEDGRMAFSTIAEKIGVSEGTVRNRVNQLREENAMQISASVLPEAFGYRWNSVVFIKLNSSANIDKVANPFGPTSMIVPSGASTSTCPAASKRVRMPGASCRHVSGAKSACGTGREPQLVVIPEGMRHSDQVCRAARWRWPPARTAPRSRRPSSRPRASRSPSGYSVRPSARRTMRSCSTLCAVGYPSLGLARHGRPA